MNLNDIIGTPFERLLLNESENTIIIYGSLCSMLKNKRLNLQSVFGLMLSDHRYLDLLTQMLDADNSRETF